MTTGLKTFFIFSGSDVIYESSFYAIQTLFLNTKKATGLFCTRIYFHGVLYDTIYWNTFNEMTVNHHEIANAVTSFERKLSGYKKNDHERKNNERYEILRR